MNEHINEILDIGTPSDSPRSEEKTPLQLSCPKCSSQAGPGTVRCPQCNHCLRPAGLGVLCTLALIGSPVMVLGALVSLPSNPLALINIIVGVACFVISLGLLKGSYASWVAIHWLWVVGAVVNLVVALYVAGQNPRYAGIVFSLLLSQLIVVALLCWYFHSQRVKHFCILGKT